MRPATTGSVCPGNQIQTKASLCCVTLEIIIDLPSGQSDTFRQERQFFVETGSMHGKRAFVEIKQADTNECCYLENSANLGSKLTILDPALCLSGDASALRQFGSGESTFQATCPDQLAKHRERLPCDAGIDACPLHRHPTALRP